MSENGIGIKCNSLLKMRNLRKSLHTKTTFNNYYGDNQNSPFMIYVVTLRYLKIIFLANEKMLHQPKDVSNCFK